MASRVLSRSRVERANRSSRVTISTSPWSSWSRVLTKLRPIGLGSAGNFAERLLAPGLGQLSHLGVNALPVCRYPGVAVFHKFILHLIYEPKSPTLSMLQFWFIIPEF